ncbi:MAG: hypothetical protein HQL50_00900 [Magnetococcales bacterium]|nr:hypothetical protein [Magnetococcales bacterium]
MKLNLGCGNHHLNGYLNVDKVGRADTLCDLESLPWPWENNSVQEIVMRHVLEHLGQKSDTFLGIMQEIYRVCRDGAVITITVPHPRSDSFLDDPTHVRPITVNGMALFSKAKNLEWAERGAANTPLGLILDVDFELTDSRFNLDEPWLSKLQQGVLTTEQIFEAERHQFNVVHEIEIVLTVRKPAQ